MSSPTLPTPQDLAYAFSRLLREELGADIDTVIALNTDEPNPSICHSHDFCDSNEVMLVAWEELCGRGHDLQSEGECAVWSAAWNLAKRSEFAIPQYLTEFPDFGPLPEPIASALAAGEIVDLSWSQDECPSFCAAASKAEIDRSGSGDAVRLLWVGYAEPSKRELLRKRYLVCCASAGYSIETDDPALALAACLAK